MGKEYLGELEELILTTVGLLREDAYKQLTCELSSQHNAVRFVEGGG